MGKQRENWRTLTDKGIALLQQNQPQQALVQLRRARRQAPRERSVRYWLGNAHRVAARLLTISVDPVITADENLHVRWLNPAAEKLFGYAPGELVGRPLNLVLPERFRAAHAEHMHNFAHGDEPSRLMGQRVTVRGLTRDGTELPLEVSISRVTTDDDVVFCAQLRELDRYEAA